jgi:putative CocE/NonD family hydrolase
VAWSPYGKSGRGFFNLDLVPGRVGVPQSRLSGYEKFEAPDPAEWTSRGYAIVNPDVRGAYDSQGNIRWWCSDEGRDGYDVTEALAVMPWCNGSVAFVGNSWLAISQWFIAAQRPPHLKCIAAFEGASDIYRELICRGGVPQRAFLDFLADQLCGEHLLGRMQKN